MYIAVLVPTLQQTHIHSDAALALHSIKPHWLATSWHRVKALLSDPASKLASDSASDSVS
ncbi:hypothetical protein B0G76_6023 [Paraburkholderia sp. BL23I1N1]|uniref:hypothetical protein n=1 Tax=Paraburkholderia sp. BL23I1N1 TaxID=1938802 RepID=UPI000FEE8B0A|nr:hypothetical protein [Paraburkholderia sp. BL23I1N1]RKE39587.1 hypothetical protein B0G76_6023 [Paraburkholderia sp. BL23I1N1]